MLWCQGAQSTGLSNRKPNSALKCTVWSQCTPVSDRHTDVHTDRQTDEDHGNSATIHSMNASRANKSLLIQGEPPTNTNVCSCGRMSRFLVLWHWSWPTRSRYFEDVLAYQNEVSTSRLSKVSG